MALPWSGPGALPTNQTDWSTAIAPLSQQYNTLLNASNDPYGPSGTEQTAVSNFNSSPSGTNLQSLTTEGLANTWLKPETPSISEQVDAGVIEGVASYGVGAGLFEAAGIGTGTGLGLGGSPTGPGPGAGGLPGVDTAAASDAGMLPPPNQPAVDDTGGGSGSGGGEGGTGSPAVGPYGPYAAGYQGATAPASTSLVDSTGGLPPAMVPGSTASPTVLGAPGYGVPGTDPTIDPVTGQPTQPSALGPYTPNAPGSLGSTTMGPTPPGLDSSSPLAEVGKFAAKYGLPLAVLGTQLLRKPSIPQEGNLNQTANTQQAQGQADIANARAGNITPAQQQQITNFTTSSMESIKQFMANSGQTQNSSAFQAESQKVQATAIAMQQGFVDQMFNQGLAEMNLANSAQAQLVQIQLQRDQQTQQALNNFMLTLGLSGAFK
jgi:hypothetical protein